MKLILIFLLSSCAYLTKSIITPQEQISIEEMGIKNIWARIDTGAHTSTMHAQDIEFKTINDEEYVEFKICHPQYCVEQKFQKKIIDWFRIRSSNGEISQRPVINLAVQLKGEKIEGDFTLYNRAKMNYPVLLGREFLSNKFLIDPTLSVIEQSAKNNIDY